MTTLTPANPTMGSTLAQGPPGPRPVPPAAGMGLSGADVLRIIRQRLVMIIIVWFLLTVGAAAFSIYMRFYYPEYSAFALVRVESLNPPDVINPLKPPTVTQEQIERELQNQALRVKSPSVLQKALEDPDLRRTNWYREADLVAQEKNESIVDLLADILVAAPIRDSNYLKVSAAWRFQKELPIIVNTVVQQYVDEVDRQQKNSIRLAEEQLGEEVDRARRNFESIKREIEVFRQNQFSAGASEEATEKLLRLIALETELSVELLGLRTQWESLREVKPEDLPITAELQAVLAQDPLIARLESQAMLADNDLELASQRYGPNHQIVKRTRLARDAARQNVERERAIKTLRYHNELIEQVHRRYREAQEQHLTLMVRVNEAKGAQSDQEIKKQTYESMRDQLELARFQFEMLSEKKSAIDMQLRAKRTVQIEFQSMAIEPKRISSPRLGIWIPAGCILGLGLSLGLAFLLELTDKSVRTPRDLLRTQLPVLGTIPTTDDDEVVIERVETASLDAPHSIVAEAFRNLRANLFFSAPAEQQGVILVTSPSGGNGKTTVATNLAISVALSGRRVLLVDANFRRVGLPRIFPNMKAEGLSNILVGQGYLGDYATSTSIPGLDVLSAGPIPPNPAELLGSSYLRDVVVDARSRYDLVIFDGPPVLLVSDAIVLAGAVDGCLLVCQYRATSRGALQRTQSSLEAINARVFGAVLNLVQTRAGGYFRKVYREFYEYHEPEEGDEAVPKLDAPRSQEDSVAPEGRLPSDSPDSPPDSPPGGTGEGSSWDALADPMTEPVPGSVVLDAETAEEVPEVPEVPEGSELPDFSDVDGLDIVVDHDLGPDQPLYESADTGESAWPDSSLDSLTDQPASDLGNDLMDLDSEDFKMGEHFEDWGGDPEHPDNPDERRE